MRVTRTGAPRRAPAPAESGDWYDHPLWYDVLHQGGTAREVRGLERIARRFTPAPAGRSPRRAPRWLEPACGSGRYLRAAARRGIDGVGLDLNPAMIAYARGRGAPAGGRVDLLVADMTRFRLGRRVDFAFCLINTVRHLQTDDAVLAHLACVARALRPGAVYALGLETCRYGAEFPSEDVWAGGRGGLSVRQVVSYRPPDRRRRREHVHSHLIISTPSGTRHFDSTYALRAYDRRQWTALLARSAMDVAGECSPDGGEVLRAPDGAPVGGYSVWVLRARRGRRGARDPGVERAPDRR